MLLAARSGLWRDETTFLRIVNLPTLTDMLDFLRLHESHPPLFYFLTRAWLGVFGSSDAAALGLPIALGVALVPVVYLVCARLSWPRAGLAAAALVAVFPPLVEYSAQVRPYSLLPLLCLISTASLARVVPAGGLGPWAAYAATTLAMLLTHHWAWLVLGAQWTIVAALLLLGVGRRRATVVREWLLAQALLLVAYAPWAGDFLRQVSHAGHTPRFADPFEHALRVFAEGAVGIPRHAPLLADVSVLVGLGAIAAWQAVRQARVHAAGGNATRPAALLLMTGLPLVTLAAAIALDPRTNVLFPRCVAMLAPGVLIAVAHAITSLTPARTLVPGALTAALAAAYLGHTAIALGDVKSNARDLAGAVATQARPADVLLITPEWIASSFTHYFRNDNLVISFPDEGRPGATRFDDAQRRRGDPAALARARAQLGTAHREGRRVWLITGRDDVIDAPDIEVLPVAQMNSGSIGRIRGNQLRAHLIRLYGPPRVELVPRGDQWGDEILTALLFSSEKTSSE